MNNLLISKPNCPYCGVLITTMPSRKKTCSACGKDIYVRTVEGNKLLLKQVDAVSLDALKNAGLMPDLAKAVRSADPQFSIRDVVWGILNKTKADYIKKNDLQSASTVTWQMARLRYEQGSEWFSIMQQAQREALLYLKNSKVCSKVEILAAQNEQTCDKCRALNGKKFTIQDALDKMPIPVQGCEWCCCTYIAVIK
ncbi:hypothetical protein [Dehalococcoides mccartyi]|uniref:hypothetical protein n=1 Tax=Dehalococcoides mccartyi TaxID=61435 RepID=UPI00075046F6|nr:hypothetical protein [Dehalococcoides mccartyi]